MKKKEVSKISKFPACDIPYKKSFYFPSWLARKLETLGRRQSVFVTNAVLGYKPEWKRPGKPLKKE
jgi:hypothetical protein